MASSRSTWVDFGKKSALQRLAAIWWAPSAGHDLVGTFWPLPAVPSAGQAAPRAGHCSQG
ncbi:hypothetical protein A2U01_0102070 [Trifolium medium]|uniref:Uncharacterized protein n=1 Tax=Trifolium medium TaxID=97028 RepID=A0A392V0N8_9FABA|nr:hypothetical protein [Trifolium medium]